MPCKTKKIAFFNIIQMAKVAEIVKKCGDDMHNKYQLDHWYNSKFKTFLIVMYMAMKNNVYAVYDEGNMIATFQVREREEALYFGKLAVDPRHSGKGIGSICLNEMENIARRQSLHSIKCEVYDKSKHALDFYLKRGFT